VINIKPDSYIVEKRGAISGGSRGYFKSYSDGANLIEFVVLADPRLEGKILGFRVHTPKDNVEIKYFRVSPGKSQQRNESALQWKLFYSLVVLCVGIILGILPN
jgi:hypothetical protein